MVCFGPPFFGEEALKRGGFFWLSEGKFPPGRPRRVRLTFDFARRGGAILPSFLKKRARGDACGSLKNRAARWRVWLSEKARGAAARPALEKHVARRRGGGGGRDRRSGGGLTNRWKGGGGGCDRPLLWGGGGGDRPLEGGGGGRDRPLESGS